MTARAQEHGEQETFSGRSEHVAMHELPAVLFLDIVATLSRVVLGEILVHGAEENHGNHSGQEEHNDERVENAEPLNLGVGHGVENVVPARGPLDLVLFDVRGTVRVRDREFRVHLGHIAWDLERLGVLGTRAGRVRLDLDTRVHNATAVFEEGRAPVFLRAVVVADLELHVIKHIKRVWFVKVRLFLYKNKI